jgi:hypothetical protein
MDINDRIQRADAAIKIAQAKAARLRTSSVFMTD